MKNNKKTGKNYREQEKNSLAESNNFYMRLGTSSKDIDGYAEKEKAEREEKYSSKKSRSSDKKNLNGRESRYDEDDALDYSKKSSKK